jgi:hypothetical protein
MAKKRFVYASNSRLMAGNNKAGVLMDSVIISLQRYDRTESSPG